MKKYMLAILCFAAVVGCVSPVNAKFINLWKAKNDELFGASTRDFWGPNSGLQVCKEKGLASSRATNNDCSVQIVDGVNCWNCSCNTSTYKYRIKDASGATTYNTSYFTPASASTCKDAKTGIVYASDMKCASGKTSFYPVEAFVLSDESKQQSISSEGGGSTVTCTDATALTCNTAAGWYFYDKAGFDDHGGSTTSSISHNFRITQESEPLTYEGLFNMAGTISKAKDDPNYVACVNRTNITISSLFGGKSGADVFSFNEPSDNGCMGIGQANAKYIKDVTVTYYYITDSCSEQGVCLGEERPDSSCVNITEDTTQNGYDPGNGIVTVTCPKFDSCMDGYLTGIETGICTRGSPASPISSSTTFNKTSGGETMKCSIVSMDTCSDGYSICSANSTSAATGDNSYNTLLTNCGETATTIYDVKGHKAADGAYVICRKPIRCKVRTEDNTRVICGDNTVWGAWIKNF